MPDHSSRRGVNYPHLQMGVLGKEHSVTVVLHRFLYNTIFYGLKHVKLFICLTKLSKSGLE